MPWDMASTGTPEKYHAHVELATLLSWDGRSWSTSLRFEVATKLLVAPPICGSLGDSQSGP